MKLAPDLVRHLKWGVPLAAVLAVVAAVAVHVGPGFAVALGAISLGMGLEHYQERRGEGVASVADAVASAAPGVVAGLIYEAWPALASAFTGA